MFWGVFLFCFFLAQELQLFHSGAWCDGAHGPGTFLFPWIPFDIFLLGDQIELITVCDGVGLSGKVNDLSS